MTGQVAEKQELLSLGSNGNKNHYGSILVEHQEEAEQGDIEPKTEILASRSGETKNTFLVVSGSYLIFTLTDGALRLVVLLTAFNHGFSAIEIAMMFALYESFGVVTNVRFLLPNSFL